MPIDFKTVRRHFTRRASGYIDASFLAREIDKRMLGKLDFVNLQPERILDLGCGPGASFTALAERYPDAALIGCDAVSAMLRAGQKERRFTKWVLPFTRLARSRSRTQLLCADARRIPLAAASIDFIWSNLMLHWVDEAIPVFEETARILRPGGLFMFSTFGPDTLKELRNCGFSTHEFVDMHDIGDRLLHSGFTDPVMSMDTITLTYEHIDPLLTELRAAGGSSARADRPTGLTGKNKWRESLARYENRRSEKMNSRLPATFEVVYGHAWKPESTPEKHDPQLAQTKTQTIRFHPQKPE